MNIVSQYKEYVHDYKTLKSRFKKLDITNTWQQVLTSRSTGIMGTGISFSSVCAEYKLNSDGTISLTNKAFDTDLKPVYITGICKYLDPLVPTCRVVKFDKREFEGEYWIIYVSKDLSTFVVGAPLIVLGKLIIPNVGLYVLTKNRDMYWKNDELQKEISKVLDDYGYTNYFNKPIFSGASKPNVENGRFTTNKVTL